MLILKALDHDQQGSLAGEGFRSLTTGITYGPVAVWFYQGLLLLSRNPVHLVFLKTLASTLILIWVLLFLSHRLVLSPWPILLCLVSPYLYFSHRILWDNVLLVPLSILLWYCAYLFWKEKKPALLALGLMFALLMLHTHIMSALLIFPIFFVLICLRWKWFLERPSWALFFFLALALSLAPYLLQVRREFLISAPDAVSAKIFGPILSGPFLFSFVGFDHGLIEEGLILPKHISTALLGITALVVVPFFFGLMVGVLETGRGIITGRWTDRAFLSACAVLVVVVVWLVFWWSGLRPHPHYYHGVWFAFFYLIWRGWDSSLQWLGKVAGVPWGFQLAATGTLLLAVVLSLRSSGGVQDVYYGPTLSNQISAVRTVLKYSPRSTIQNDVENYNLFPHAFYALVRLFDGRCDEQEARPVCSIRLYQKTDPRSQWIHVEVEDFTKSPGASIQKGQVPK